MTSATVLALSAFPEQLERFFLAVPEPHQHWAPASWEGIPSESFTAIEQICHVRDIEVEGYHARFRRMLEEDTPYLESIDGYALARQRRYSEAAPEVVFEDIRAARCKTLERLQGLSDLQWARTGYLEGYGRLTVIGLVHYLCSHDQQHLAGLQWLLGRMQSGATAPF
ncbi:DinB family protein [Pseudomonas benzenivorans]|uniref:DinB family protein n=1 Tax=Pseudomonas benzenivorans TaxID=556533 RepID=A0ABZ0PZE7_9PSED|nr:DinB family protein [Pseudomonas benzenivorans]WPC06229.1 DinB family protein [Pseudomonas benzenivorans]